MLTALNSIARTTQLVRRHKELWLDCCRRLHAKLQGGPMDRATQTLSTTVRLKLGLLETS